MRLLHCASLLLLAQLCSAQNIESFGLYGGFNIPFTLDEGLRNDNRFHGQFTLRGTPIGFSYGYDRVGRGFLVSPGYMEIGQKFTIQNYVGGEVGTRDVTMKYLSLPVALKLHLNDISFFRLSLVASLNFSFLLKGQETLTIDAVPSARKLVYPAGVSVPQSPDYQVTYDGVYVPNLSQEVYVSSDKFSSFQIFAGVGFHSDFDLNDDWSIYFDGRANFGVLDPRSSSYLDQLKNPSGPPDAFTPSKPAAPDLYGQRRDIYLSATFGFCRIIQIKEKFHSKSNVTYKKPAVSKSKKRK